MVNLEKIKEMPLEKLLVYYQALKEICEKYAADMKPLYNSGSPREKSQWVAMNSELQHVSMYRNIVMAAMKSRAITGLDNYEKPEKPKKKPMPKKPIQKIDRAPKKKKSEKDA